MLFRWEFRSQVISHLAHEPRATTKSPNSSTFSFHFVLRKREVSKCDLWWNPYQIHFIFKSSIFHYDRGKRAKKKYGTKPFRILQCCLADFKWCNACWKWCCGDIIDVNDIVERDMHQRFLSFLLNHYRKCLKLIECSCKSSSTSEFREFRSTFRSTAVHRYRRTYSSFFRRSHTQHIFVVRCHSRNARQ